MRRRAKKIGQDFWQNGFARVAAIPQTVKALALVSAFMNITSVVITVLTPLLIVSVFGADTRTMGMIEGVVVATFHFTKIFSGVISDFFRTRKILIVIGYGVSALCMPILAMAPSVGWVFFGRFVERLSNGLRDAPRDALIGDVTPKSMTGIAYGFRQAFASFGSLIGPLIVSVFISFSCHNYQNVFWWATIPAAIAVMICIFGVQDRRPQQGPAGNVNPLQFSQLRLLQPKYWKLVFVSAAFMAARYSESFLVLRAESVGLPVAHVPLVLVLMNLTYCLTSIPIGSFADRIDKRLFLMGGFLSLVIANIFLATHDTTLELAIGVMIWGLHMAFTQGILLAMVANTAPAHLRGTAFGFFHLINGVGQLCGNAVLGQLWHHYGIQSAFLASASMLILPLLGLFFLEKTGKEQDH